MRNSNSGFVLGAINRKRFGELEIINLFQAVEVKFSEGVGIVKRCWILSTSTRFTIDSGTEINQWPLDAMRNGYV